ncbi:nitrate reductase cytochrome c-type subunit [Zoogloea sp.]|uniref:nitrate reductase cytochrome c-type subunit n=1 Tax=Zoogloea sp. TaxID=49181 RepID=UPI0035AFA430
MNTPIFQSARLLAATLAVCLAPTLFAPQAVQAATEGPVKLQTLRGAEIDASDPEGEGTRYGRDQPVLPRDFVQQPPLIPHAIRGYTITKNFNKCLDCHSWSRAKETGATKISVTHFKTRDGEELSSVSPRRYFCVQCHVPQSDAKPLVGNTFKPGSGLR